MTGAVASKRVTEAPKGSLRADGNRSKSVKAEGSLTARRTGRAGTKVGLSDPVVPSGRAIAQRIKATLGITGLSPPRVHIDGADDAAITVYDTADDLAAAVQAAGKPVVLLPNYTSMLTVRDKLSALAGGGRFWE